MHIPYRFWLTRLGEHMSCRQIGGLSAAVKYLEIGRVMGELGYRLEPRVDKREELFDLVGREVGKREVLYLEFGVYQGDATRYWSKMLGHPASKLHGFDSFEGLPEAWTDTMTKGHFSTEGAIPVIDDPRVRFFKGWFDQTLANYQVPAHEVLVLNLDADLYSSTKCVLDHMSPHIVPGTYLYFDEFNDPENELRAFQEFSSACKLKIDLRGATNSLQNVLFQVR
jgi:O-methyltransferase